MKFIPDREEVKCNTCDVVKPRIKGPMVRAQHQYVDEKGKVWARRQCPECKVLSSKRYNLKTPKNKYYTPIETKAQPLYFIAQDTKLRNCRKCNVKTVNYFHCRVCLTGMAAQSHAGISVAEFYALHGGS